MTIPKYHIVVDRLEENYDFGTFGVLKINSQIFCVTLEPRDEENQTNISSIPAQQYICKRTKSSLVERLTKGRLDESFQIMDVPGRTHCIFHPGNSAKNTLGCTLIAEKFGKLYGNRAILNSGETFLQFMSTLEDTNEFVYTVREHY